MNIFIEAVLLQIFQSQLNPLNVYHFSFSKMRNGKYTNVHKCSFIVITRQVRFWQILHYKDVIMGAIASQITSLAIVYSIVYSDADQRKHQSSAPLAFVWWIHRGPVNSPHKWPVTRKMFPFDDGIVHKVRNNRYLSERIQNHPNILQYLSELGETRKGATHLIALFLLALVGLIWAKLSGTTPDSFMVMRKYSRYQSWM